MHLLLVPRNTLVYQKCSRSRVGARHKRRKERNEKRIESKRAPLHENVLYIQSTHTTKDHLDENRQNRDQKKKGIEKLEMGRKRKREREDIRGTEGEKAGKKRQYQYH